MCNVFRHLTLTRCTSISVASPLMHTETRYMRSTFSSVVVGIDTLSIAVGEWDSGKFNEERSKVIPGCGDQKWLQLASRSKRQQPPAASGKS